MKSHVVMRGTLAAFLLAVFLFLGCGCQPTPEALEARAVAAIETLAGAVTRDQESEN